MENENEIIRQVIAGQMQAFGLVYDAYIKKIYTFVYWKTSHRETAEDLTSQIFFKALRSLAQYQADKGSFSSWLYTIARHTIIDYYRTNKPEYDLAIAEKLAEQTDLTEEIDRKADRQKIKLALDKLSEEQRDIVVLRVWHELSYREIAAIVGKNEASCKMAFSRAVRRLKDELPWAVWLAWLLAS